MIATVTQGAALERFLPDDEATATLGEDLAMALRPGDLLALAGDLGAGKTTLARGLIRAMAGDPGLEVPSPTFTLAQSYDTRVPVHHLDLYRLGSPDELDELGLDEALVDGAALVEWPDRAADRLPRSAVRVELAHKGAGRLARISGDGAGFDRIARSLAARGFMAASGYGHASRVHFAGDASARSYETVTPGPEPLLLMNSPSLVLGPPVQNGKAYAEIAHTARTAGAFVAIDRALAVAGIAVPEIVAEDLEQGFLLISHLGGDGFLGENGAPIASRYAAAATLLARIHARTWTDRLEVSPGVSHQLPPFDRDAMMIEVDLLLDWYIPYATGKPAEDLLRSTFHGVWDKIISRVINADVTLMLRDFHSPNIIWRDDRQGLDRLGIMDFQDALLGPAAYDVASLAMDARVTVPPEMEASTVAAYVAARQALGAFDVTEFHAAYAAMAAQRNSKILGIFVRLDRRDSKPTYLKHLPRIRGYLARALAHPALAELRDFYRKHDLTGEPR